MLFHEYCVQYNNDEKHAVVTVPEAGIYAVAFAVYNERGRLIGTELQSPVLSVGKNVVTPQIFAIDEAKKIRVMLWENTASMKPLCEADERILQ